MKFSKIRQTIIKRTGVQPDPAVPATPQMLSPFIGGQPEVPANLRPGVDLADVARPLHNRRSRRAMGRTKPRHRVPGVSIPPGQQLWKPIEFTKEEQPA